MKRVTILQSIVCTLLSVSLASAAFVYRIENEAVTITGYVGTGPDHLVIPATIEGFPVTSIAVRAFTKLAFFTSVTIATSVTRIEDLAFEGTRLNSVTIPENVTFIGYAAFSDCLYLTSITIPVSVTRIGYAPFRSCTRLTSISVSADNPNYSSQDGVLFNKDKTELIQYPGGKTGSYAIPASVTSIKPEAFSGCTSLTTVTIPESITSIERLVFSNCINLTSVTLPESITSIGYMAFSGCASLTSVTLPGSVTNIINRAFRDCTSLTSVTLPESVTSIGQSVFLGCTSLTNIAVSVDNPNYSSQDGVLLNKDKTELIQYPGGKSGSYAIPASVTSIGNYAFGDCSDLTAVTFSGHAHSVVLGGSVFLYSTPTIYRRQGTSGWEGTFAGRPVRLWPEVSAALISPAGLSFSITASDSQQFIVEAASALIPPDWQPIYTGTVVSAESYDFTDPDAASHSQRFYRISLE